MVHLLGREHVASRRGAPVSEVPGFWRFAAAHPDALAAVGPSGKDWTFGELADRVDRTSHWLRSAGVGPDGALALVAGNSVEYLSVVLAAAKIGTRYTLVNRHLAGPEIGYILGDCAPRLVVTDAALAPVVRPLIDGARLACLDPVDGLEAIDAELAAQPSGPPPDRRGGSIMLYTSR